VTKQITSELTQDAANPDPTAWIVEAVAQICTRTTAEREEAHLESSLESDRLLQPALSQRGTTVSRVLYAGPETRNRVQETYHFARYGVPFTVPVTGLRNYRFAPHYSPFLDPMGGCKPTYLYRHLPLLRAGNGVGAMSTGSVDSSMRANRVLPLRRALVTDEQRRVYRVPAPMPLNTSLFSPQSPDRGRAVYTALELAGRTAPAALVIRAEAVPVDALVQSYLERAARLIGETPGATAYTPSQQILEQLAIGPCAYIINISATNATIARAFQADTDPRGLVDYLPQTEREWLESAERKELCGILDGLAAAYTLEEAATLLTPAISFQDALPGARHFFPQRLRTGDETGRRRTAHHDPEGDFEIGTTVSGTRKTMNLEWLRTGCVIVGPPGTGKTTAGKNLVRQVRRLRGKELAINLFDPVGYEWIDVATEIGARVIRFEPGQGAPLTFNPFFAAPNVTLADHASTLAQLLTAVFPGNRTAQSYLESMVRGTYSACYRRAQGKELDLVRTTGRDQLACPDAWPDFDGFLNHGPRFLASLANAQGSKHLAESVEYFKLRGNLMRNSLLAEMLSGRQPLSPQLQGSFLLSLQQIGSHELKHAILALILGLYLNEINTDARRETVPSLSRLIVLEEAHEILGRQQAHHSDEMAEGADALITKWMIDVLRTRRKFGVGTLIVDQSLSSLVEDVLKNCSNKLALRTHYGPDQETLSRLLGISAHECRDLADLETGECIAQLEGDCMPSRVQLDAG
jgi:hypothetical protein